MTVYKKIFGRQQDARRSEFCHLRKKKTQKSADSIRMYIQNFIMEYSVESVFPVNANGLHNITQWKTKPIYNPRKKIERKSCFLFYSTALCWASNEHPLKTMDPPHCNLNIYIQLTISSQILLALRCTNRVRGHAVFLSVMLRWWQILDGGF